MSAGMSQALKKFLLNFLLIPTILSLMLYAFSKPILWGALTFLGLCMISILSFLIIKKLLTKKPQKGDQE